MIKNWGTDGTLSPTGGPAAHPFPFMGILIWWMPHPRATFARVGENTVTNSRFYLSVVTWPTGARKEDHELRSS
jgi:hypothetical protein